MLAIKADRAHFADFTRLNVLPQSKIGREVSHIEHVAHNKVALARGAFDLIELRAGSADRLIADHMLAGSECRVQQSSAPTETVPDCDHIAFHVAQKLLEATMSYRNIAAL